LNALLSFEPYESKINRATLTSDGLTVFAFIACYPWTGAHRNLYL